MLLVAIAAGIAGGPSEVRPTGSLPASRTTSCSRRRSGSRRHLVFSITGYLSGSRTPCQAASAWWIPVVTATVGSAVGVILYGVLGTVPSAGRALDHT